MPIRWSFAIGISSSGTTVFQGCRIWGRNGEAGNVSGTSEHPNNQISILPNMKCWLTNSWGYGEQLNGQPIDHRGVLKDIKISLSNLSN